MALAGVLAHYGGGGGGSPGGERPVRPGKDPVFSRPCAILEEQRERTGDLFDRTIVVKVLQGGKPILRDDFADPLSEWISLKEVIFLATVGRGDEWHITLASKEAKASLMGAGRLVVAGRRCLVQEDERWRGRPGSWAYPVVRVHWNDPSLPLGEVPAQLRQHGEIISDVFEEAVSRKFDALVVVGVPVGVAPICSSGAPAVLVEEVGLVGGGG